MGGSRSSVAVAVAVAAAFTLSSLCAPARAALVGTEQIVSAAPQRAAQARVDAFLERADVRQQLESWGVAPADAQARVAALSDAEIVALSARIDDVPAGGIFEVIGVVFVVLLILELVGVTNIFSKI